MNSSNMKLLSVLFFCTICTIEDLSTPWLAIFDFHDGIPDDHEESFIEELDEDNDGIPEH